MSYTYALLEVSAAAYDEIEAKLREAGHHQAFHQDHEVGVVIDMHGVALSRGPDRPTAAVVRFVPGDVLLPVAYVAEGFARNALGRCAFCNGDPCAEESAPDTPIAQYASLRGAAFETCPFCRGVSS
jgi:hypothetical protein